MSEKIWTLGGSRFRVREWVDLTTNETWFGIQCKPKGERRYMHACEGKDALIFRLRSDALAKISALTARPTPEAKET
jgi:hypothetical protein